MAFDNEVSTVALGLVFSVAFLLYGITTTTSKEEFNQTKISNMVISYGFGLLVGLMVLLRYGHYLQKRETKYGPLLAAVFSLAITLAVIIIICM